MIRIFFIIFLLCVNLQVFAFEYIEYKNLKNGTKLIFSEKGWSTSISKKQKDYSFHNYRF